MARPAFQVAEVFRRHGEAYREANAGLRIPTMATPSLGRMATPHSGVATAGGWCERHHWGVGHLSVERLGQGRRRPSP